MGEMGENERLAGVGHRSHMPDEICRGSLMAMLFDGRASSEAWIEALIDRMQAREVVR